MFPVFKANQLFSLEINVLYNLILNMGMFTYGIKISNNILPLSNICLEDWSPLCADVIFTRDIFHSNLRKTDVFSLKPGAPKWNKERSKTAIRRYGL